MEKMFDGSAKEITQLKTFDGHWLADECREMCRRESKCAEFRVKKIKTAANPGCALYEAGSKEEKKNTNKYEVYKLVDCEGKLLLVELNLEIM